MRITGLNVLALAGAATAQQAHMMRFACSQLTVERLDPLVNPGVVGTPHTHQIVGGNSLRAEMKPLEYDQVERSTCTSCTFSEGESHQAYCVLVLGLSLITGDRLFELLDGGAVFPRKEWDVQASEAG